MWFKFERGEIIPKHVMSLVMRKLKAPIGVITG